MNFNRQRQYNPLIIVAAVLLLGPAMAPTALAAGEMSDKQSGSLRID